VPAAVGRPAPTRRLHRGGSFRRRLAVAFGRDPDAGDALWRRILHGSGAFVLVYFLLPDRFFVVVPKDVVLLAALAGVGVLEALRLLAGVELPTIRGYEARRPASFVFYAVALVGAVLLAPEAIAAAVVLGTAFVDPIAGDLRSSGRSAGLAWGLPFVVYAALAAVALAGVGRWPWELAVGLGAVAAAVGVAVERWRFRWLDDDLTMTVVPALVLYVCARAIGGLGA
jgi:hypothetical protein